MLTRFSGGLFTDIRDLICVDDVMEDDDLRFEIGRASCRERV
mgnify:CR=1 FL=1